MTKITLENTFHRTAVTILVPDAYSESPVQAWQWLQWANLDRRDTPEWRAVHRKYTRVCRDLCGISDCQCGVVRP